MHMVEDVAGLLLLLPILLAALLRLTERSRTTGESKGERLGRASRPPQYIPDTVRSRSLLTLALLVLVLVLVLALVLLVLLFIFLLLHVFLLVDQRVSSCLFSHLFRCSIFPSPPFLLSTSPPLLLCRFADSLDRLSSQAPPPRLP